MNEPVALFLLGIGLMAVLAGPVIALVALLQVGRLERRLAEMQDFLRRSSRPPGPPEEAPRAAPAPEGRPPAVPAAEAPSRRASASPGPTRSPWRGPALPAGIPGEAAPVRSLEIALGTRWFARVGVVMLLFGVAYFLKYAYDNEWIGPRGRLAIGALAGLAALALGERCRRKGWPVFFQTLTGGGLAAFYLCVFYSFQVYHLLAQAPSFALAVGVTALAVALAVAHRAQAIALLALVGGFLSPVLLSTGENRPHALFLYVLVLDLVALGCACFRRWRALDAFCFLATAALYLGWFRKFYAKDQMLPALLYASIFYLVFVLGPLLNGLVRRVPDPPEALALPALSAAWAFFYYHRILFADHRPILGFVVLGQALVLLGLFWVWSRRRGRVDRAAQVLLATALALVLLAVPMHLRLYGVPLAWAAEGVVLIFIGRRQNSFLCRVGGLLGLGLAFGGLVARLPLHEVPFTPVWNAPLGSWAFVVAAAAAGARLLRAGAAPWERWAASALGILAYAAGGFALSNEAFFLWEFQGLPYSSQVNNQFRSLAILWALIPVGTLGVLERRGAMRWAPLAWIGHGLGLSFFLGGMVVYDDPSRLPFLHAGFAAFLAPALSMGGAAWWHRRRGYRRSGAVLELAGHGVLAILLAVELMRWSGYADGVSRRIDLGLVSAAWALQAFVLVWLGLRGRDRVRRYAGFFLFVLTVGKIWLVDMGALEPVYRVLSFLACGLLLVVAGFAYQRLGASLERRAGVRGPASPGGPPPEGGP